MNCSDSTKCYRVIAFVYLIVEKAILRYGRCGFSDSWAYQNVVRQTCLGVSPECWREQIGHNVGEWQKTLLTTLPRFCSIEWMNS